MSNLPIPDPNLYERFSLLDQREIILHSIMRSQFQEQTNIFPSKKVSIITPTNKLIYMRNIISNYLQQQYQNKELIIVLNDNQLDINQWLNFTEGLENIQIYQLDESITLGEAINYAIDKSSGDYIAKFDDDDYYAPMYLTDLIHCFSYTDASVVGKVSQFVYFESMQSLYLLNSGMGYNYNQVWGGTHVIKREVLDEIRFEHVNIAEDVYFNDDCTGLGFKQYGADPFNFLRIRRADKDYHTYKKEDEDYISWCNFLFETDKPKPFVIV